MQVNKPIELFISKNIYDQLKTCIIKDKKYNINIQEIYYLIHYIIIKELTTDDNRKFNGFIAINRDKFKVITKSKLKEYIKLLLKYEIIICDNIYIPDKKPLGYKINIEYHYDFHYIEVKPGTKIFDRISKKIKNKKTHYNKDPEYIKTMRKAFMKTEFYYTGAMNYIRNVPDDIKKLSYHIALKQLQDKRFRYFKRNNTNNRLDSNFTNLPKEMRSFIIGEYVSIDLKNSQPFFLAQFLRMILYNNILTATTDIYRGYNRGFDVVETFGISILNEISIIRKIDENSFFANYSKFEKWTLEGKFYDHFMSEFKGKLTRDQVKDIMFAVLFSHNLYNKNNKIFVPYKDHKKVFASVFPEMYQVIKTLKNKDHSQLAIFLQKMESYVFIDCIAKELVNNGIVPLTIHDSVIVDAKHEAVTMAIIEKTFMELFKCKPAFHVEKLGQLIKAGQERKEIAKPEQPRKFNITDGNIKPKTLSEIGITAKESMTFQAEPKQQIKAVNL